MKRSTLIIIGVVLVFCVYGCTSYNGMLDKYQTVENAWADVQTKYQQRYDALPNLMATVKGAANFEKSTLTDVIEARSKATSVKISVDDLTPENLQKIQNAQQPLTNAVSRLLATVESYPDLKANQNFLTFQSQIEGLENRIAVARRDFNKSVKEYNSSVLSFPTVIFAKIFGYDKKAYFEASDSAQAAPKVEF